MATVYKKKYTKPLPQNAEVFSRKGERFARWRDAKGRSRVAIVTVAAFVFSFGPPIGNSNVAWAQCDEAGKLLAPDGALNDQFGQSVAVSGDVAVVGARTDDDNGTNSGSAHVYRFNGSSWVWERKLLPSDGAAYDAFGSSVAIDGDTIVIGAPSDDDNGTSSGSAYVFGFSGSTWFQEQKLVPSDGASGDLFGSSVAISGDAAVVGAFQDDANGLYSGSAYVFGFNGSSWVQEQKLLPSDGAAVDFFGFSLAVSGDVVVIGAYADDDNGNASGSAYVFRFNGSTWNEQSKLLASDGETWDFFGYSVAVSADVTVVGSFQDDDHGGNFGSAYVFRFDGSAWIEEAELYGSDSATNDKFGFSVSVDADLAVIGAYEEGETSQGHGSAYVFRYDGSDWNEESRIINPSFTPPDDYASGDKFGYSVAVSGDVAVIGAYGDDDNGSSSGSAYLFHAVGASACPWDLNGDGAVGALDLALVLGFWGPNPGHSSDLNGDGDVGPLDLALVLANWGPCP